MKETKEEVKEAKTEPNKIQLPTVVQQPKTKNLQSLILYGLPKCGKTTAVSKLPNSLIIDLEEGSNFVEGLIIKPPTELKEVGRFKWLKELAQTIVDAGRPYDYVVIDTLSQIDVESEWVGTYNYMNSITGKNFNRTDAGEKRKPSDPSYESVLSLANGFGYRYSREAIIDMFNTLKGLGKICTIFICHVADKEVAKSNSGTVVTKDLALTGKVKDILPRVVDGLAKIWTEDGEIMISFDGNSDKLGGVRPAHLRGYAGPLDWNKIFITE